jgi:anti-sigma regulatory factor (Ser/Thr protein kinase)
MTSGESAVGADGGPAAAEVRFCLAFQREALSVPVMRRVLGGVLRSLGVDDDSVADILLAATEACTNVLRHGGPGISGYAVVASVGEGGCEVEVAEVCSGPDGASRGTGRRWTARFSARGRPGPPQRLTIRPGVHRLRQAAQRPGWRHGFCAGSRAKGPAEGAHATAGPGTADTATADTAQLAESGRGLDVMRACVDDVTLRNSPGQGTVVTMRKRIHLSDDAPLSRLRPAS